MAKIGIGDFQMNRNFKALIAEMDQKNQYKKKSTSITKEGTIIEVGSEGRQEIAMVLKFVKGSQVGRPHEDYIVIGTYKYSDINAAILTNSDDKPPILLIIAKITGKNSYKILKDDQLELQKRIRDEAGKDKTIQERCDDLFKLELLQCITSEMSYAYNMNREAAADVNATDLPVADFRVDLSGPSAIDANTIAVVEDQDVKIDTTALADADDVIVN